MSNRTPTLEPDLLLHAYAHGLFPMGMQSGEIGWFSPDPRGLIPLDEEFHIPHGLKRTLKKQPFDIRINTAFPEVMRQCAKRDETWIDETIYKAYVRLHYMGHAHSVECWQDDQLVGGLYGVSLRGAFFGESMFTRATDASKVALVWLVTRLREREYFLLDTQWTTQHLRQFGAKDIPRTDYMKTLRRAMKVERSFAP